MSSSDLKELTRLIFKLEDELNLLSFSIDDIHIWQYLRMEIYYTLARKTGILPSDRKNSKLSLRSKLQLSLNLIRRNPFLCKTKSVDSLIVTHNRSKKIENKHVDIYTHYLIETLKEKGGTLIELEKPFNGQHNRSATKDKIYNDFIQVYSILRGKFYKIKERQKIDEIIKIQNRIYNETGVKLNLVSFFRVNIGRFIYSEKLYQKLLNRIKPTIIFIVVGYSYMGSLISAAKKMNIKTIELQHGVISNYHLGYAFSKKINLDYWPEYFYSWGTYWNQYVENSFERDKIVTYGFDHINKLTSKYQKAKRNKSVIVLSQAAIGELIMNKTLECLEIFDNYEIFYKLHPEEYSMYQNYQAYLDLSSQKNITFLEDCDLYEYLSFCEVQIGVFSTAIFEGLAFNCRTYLYEISGIEYMQELLDSGYALRMSEFEKTKNSKQFESEYFFATNC